VVNKKVIEIVAKCKKAKMSFGEIARELNYKGFKTVRGNKFYRNTIKRLYERCL